MEIIARKKKHVAIICFFTLILSVIAFIGSIFLLKENDFKGFIGLIVSIFLFCYSVYCILKAIKTSDVIISFDDKTNTLVFNDSSCSLDDVARVEQERVRSRYFLYKWGSIIIYLKDGDQKEFDFVEDVVSVQNKIYELLFKHKENK